jgi:hypothetical protein
MPPHPFAGNPAQWYQNDPLADKRQDLFYKDQEVGQLCRQITHTLQMLDDLELSTDTRAELLNRVCELTNIKTELNREKEKMAIDLRAAEQKMLAERAARHREEEELKEERDNKMPKYDGMRGGKSSRGGRGGRNNY